LQANQVGSQDRGHRLVVAGPTAVEEAVLLEEHERIERPVLALRLDDVEMGDEEERLARAGAAIAGDQIVLARVRAAHLDVRRRESGGLQPRGHRFRGFCDVARGRIGRVDLNELLENLPRFRVVRTGLRGYGGDGEGRERERGEWSIHAPIIAIYTFVT